jgi:LacI family transcriptional regulator, galactose operon repressor
MSVTLEEIAKATGFSVPTVSRALTNRDYPLSATTRQRIIEVAREMGYMPNLTARSLRTDQSNTIGIIVDDILSPFAPRILRGIQDYLKLSDYLNLIMNSDWYPEVEQEAISTLLSRPVDGIIFVENAHLKDNDALRQSRKPYVFVHRFIGSKVTNSIVPDNYDGVVLAIRHLVALGHRRIAFINGPDGYPVAHQRLQAYKEELVVQNLEFDPTLVDKGDWEYEGGYKAAKNLLKLANLPTAIFVANDVMALGAIDAIQEVGLNVPRDLAIVGYDNRDFTSIVHPRITTVTIPAYEMGQLAAEFLLKQIKDGRQEMDEIKVKGQLLIRETCGADPSQQSKDEEKVGTASRRSALHKNSDG